MYVVEVELSIHNTYSHVIPQITKFINGIKKRDHITRLISNYIRTDKIVEARIKTKVDEVYEFINELADNPTIVVIIDKLDDKFREAMNTIRYNKLKIIEFITYRRIGTNLKNIHIIKEPMHIQSRIRPSPVQDIEIKINHTCIKYALLQFNTKYRKLLPGYKIPFVIETDIGEIETKVTSAQRGAKIGESNAGKYIQGGLSSWYKAHPEIEVGSIVRIIPIEHYKRYKLEIVKSSR